MGEGFETDAAIMPYITSVNIACGYHAGDENTMRRTVELALKHNVVIGAHPSYPDKANFGRTDMVVGRLGDHGGTLRPENLPRIITDQVKQLEKICAAYGTTLHHIKPHGALYNRAAWDGVVSSFICSAIEEINPSLIFYGLSGSEMQKEASLYNIRFASEVFADRTYQEDGSLTPRIQSNAMITDTEQSIQQVLKMVKQGSVTAVTGKDIPVKADTICIHGDGEHALAFAQHIHQSLKQNGIEIKPL